VRPTAKKVATPLAAKAAMNGLLKMNADPPIEPMGSASWSRTLDNGLAGRPFRLAPAKRRPHAAHWTRIRDMVVFNRRKRLRDSGMMN
jgi:hypothetical protein